MNLSFGSKTSPVKGGFLALMLGSGQGVKGILANAGTNVTSGLTVGSKALQKLDKGGIAPGTKSITGRSIASSKTKKDTMSRTGTKKSKGEIDIADMEIEEIEAIIEEKDREMRLLLKDNKRISMSKSMNQGAKDSKMKPNNDRMAELKE